VINLNQGWSVWERFLIIWSETGENIFEKKLKKEKKDTKKGTLK
jgi:hypothetical protein